MKTHKLCRHTQTNRRSPAEETQYVTALHASDGSSLIFGYVLRLPPKLWRLERDEEGREDAREESGVKFFPGCEATFRLAEGLEDLEPP